MHIIYVYIILYISIYIYNRYIIYIYIYIIYIHTNNSLAENSLIFILFMLWLQSFEAPATGYMRLKKLTSFNNTTLNKSIQKALDSWVLRILSLFDFQKIDCGKAPEALSQCLYGCIRYRWVWVKQLI